jgi:predicted acyl esterase
VSRISGKIRSAAFALMTLSLLLLSGAAVRAAGRDRAVATPIYGGTRFPVYYRTALPTDSPGARYPGYRPEKSLLRAGTVRGESGLPLSCDIMFERDVPVRLRDGTIIYADVFRPADEGRYPAIMCVSPFGKETGCIVLDDFPDRLGVSKNITSGLERFGGLDPAYWVLQGYVIVNPDPRGVGSSHGNAGFFGRQTAEDGYDMVEWIAVQPWSNGRVGMAGAFWLAAYQWFTAAEQPPHLEAIAPWGGFADFYRDVGTRGGIPSPEWPGMCTARISSRTGLVENLPQMIMRYPFVNAYWKDKEARLENVTLPIYAAAGYDDFTSGGGAFDAYSRAASREKWLRVYTGNGIGDLYNPLNQADLTKFFDYYLKDMNNGWESTPRVRLSVYDLGHDAPQGRAENVYPPASVQNTCLYLNADNGTLSMERGDSVRSVSYDGDDERSSVSFTYTFERNAELTGYMSLHLWAAAADHDDMDLAVSVEKLDQNGRVLSNDSFGPVISEGRIRASCRAVDDTRSVSGRPRLLCGSEQKLTPEVPVVLDIALTPVGMVFHAGEKLRLTIMPYTPAERRVPFGTADVNVPRDSFTVSPGDAYEVLQLKGGAPVDDPEVSAASQNMGAHIIYTGGEYDSYLQVPVIPMP